MPINNTETENAGIGIGGSPPLPRSPLTLLNPADIASISILKDAAAAIYGTRAANGVIPDDAVCQHLVDDFERGFHWDAA